MIAGTVVLAADIIILVVSLKIQDEAHKARELATRQREEATAFYAQAIVRNDEAIEAQLEAARMLEAVRAITQEHSP